jgi:hypothetical protein
LDDNIAELVERLGEKEDKIRYPAFQRLMEISENSSDVYPYWDTLAAKLSSDNSYQRSIGAMLLSRNARWDAAGHFDEVIGLYAKTCDDEKFITARQALQGIPCLVPYEQHLAKRLIDALTAIDITKRKDTQRKLLLMDTCAALAAIGKYCDDDRIAAYITAAATGGMLDKKSAKEVLELLK